MSLFSSYIPPDFFQGLPINILGKFKEYFKIDNKPTKKKYDLVFIHPKGQGLSTKISSTLQKARLSNYLICPPLQNRTELIYYLTKKKLPTHWINYSIDYKKKNKEVVMFVWMDGGDKPMVRIAHLQKISATIKKYLDIVFQSLDGVFRLGNFRYQHKDRVGSFQVYRFLFDFEDQMVDIHPLQYSYVDNLEKILSTWLKNNSLSFSEIKKIVKLTFPDIKLLLPQPIQGLDQPKTAHLYHSTTNEIPYIQHFIDKAFRRLGYQKVEKEHSLIGEAVPENKSLSFVYGTILKFPKMDYAKHDVKSVLDARSQIENQSPFITNMSKGVTDFLSNKKIFFDAVQNSHPERVRRDNKKKTFDQHRILFTFSFVVGDNGSYLLSKGKEYQKLKKMLSKEFQNQPDMSWIFKPANGSQGKGIFIQTALRENNLDEMVNRVLTQLKQQCTHYQKREFKNYREWIGCQFIDKPLLFNPFTESAVLRKHLHDKYNFTPDLGHKSHLRFYMAVKQDRFHKGIDYYVHPEPVIFIAALPYQQCQECFQRDQFAMSDTQYCNQSNLSKNSEYFKQQKLKSNPYRLFSSSARDAFSQRYRDVGGKNFFDLFIYPQIMDIAHIVKESVETFKVPLRCQNSTLETTCPGCYRGCLQYLAVDVLFDDGHATHGIPHAWLLEVNTRPGMMGMIHTEHISKSCPKKQKQMEDLFYNVYRGINHPYSKNYDDKWVKKMIRRANKEIKLFLPGH